MSKYQRFPVNLEEGSAKVLLQGVKSGVWALNFGRIGRAVDLHFDWLGERITNGVVTDVSQKSKADGTFRAILNERCRHNRHFLYLLAGEAR
jgi:hypothetical protein